MAKELLEKYSITNLTRRAKGKAKENQESK
jgi:hypothetical protein